MLILFFTESCLLRSCFFNVKISCIKGQCFKKYDVWTLEIFFLALTVLWTYNCFTIFHLVSPDVRPFRRTVTRENNCILSRRSYNTKVCEIDPLSKKCDFSKWCMPSLYNSCLMIGRNYDNKLKRCFSWHCLVNSNDGFCTFSIAFWHVPLSVRSVIIVALYTSTCWYATFLS